MTKCSWVTVDRHWIDKGFRTEVQNATRSAMRPSRSPHLKTQNLMMTTIVSRHWKEATKAFSRKSLYVRRVFVKKHFFTSEATDKVQVATSQTPKEYKRPNQNE